MTSESASHRLRLAIARDALSAYNPDDEGFEVAMTDLLTDLMHLAKAEGVEFNHVLDMANTHFDHEN